MFRPVLTRASRRAVCPSSTNIRPLSTLRPRACTTPVQSPNLSARTQRRNVSNLRREWESIKIGARVNFKKSPAGMAGAFSVIGILMVIGAYELYHYFTRIEPINHNYPEKVAAKLRRALYFSSTDMQPQKALQNYKQAIEVAQEEGMDMFSDEVIGIKIKIAAFFEHVQAYQNAIQTLERVQQELLEWLNVFGESRDPEKRADRTRILKKVVSVYAKLGDLYSNEFTNDLEAAEVNLVKGVEMSLKELQRRQKDGVLEGDGDWFSNEEMGGEFEQLAHHFEERSRFQLAAPLFLRAITLDPPRCHASIIMNNLAGCLAQTDPDRAHSTPTSRAALISNARSWAERALSVAQAVKPPERTEECDMGCAVATHNLGEFAEMEGLVEEARKRYEEAEGLSKAISFQEGVQQAKDGLKRLDGKGK